MESRIRPALLRFAENRVIILENGTWETHMDFSISEYLSELETLVNIDSGFGNPDGATAVGDYFAKRFASLGWLIERHDLRPDAGVCTVIKNRERAHYDLMLVGHVDTVFPAGEAAKRPFRMDDRRAYGCGVFDMKQGCLAIYHVLSRLPKAVTDALDILVIYNPDEEIGSVYSAPILDSYAKMCDYAFILEAATADGARAIERKGLTNCHVTLRGRSGHAGYIFENDALSAVNETAYWIHALNQLHDRGTGTSVNVGVVRAGKASNIVPDEAHMEFEARYERMDEGERVRATIEQLVRHAEANGLGVAVEKLRATPPLTPDARTLAYAERMRRISEGLNIPFLHRKRGGISDANHIALNGPVCVDGLAPSGGFAHSQKEYLELSSIEPSLRFVHALICDLAQQKAT